MDRIQLINHYLSKKSYSKYLEIGVHTGNTLRCIDANLKNSVDPNPDSPADFHITSDEFFSKIAPTFEYKYDVIFIDGLHHTEQVDRDIENSLKYLEEDGVVILHDCNPISEMRQRVPADFDIWEYGWNGDVWKSIFKFRLNNSYKNYKVFVIDSDEGLGVIKPNQIGEELKLKMPNTLDYEFLDLNRTHILNLIKEDEFLSYE